MTVVGVDNRLDAYDGIESSLNLFLCPLGYHL